MAQITEIVGLSMGVVNPAAGVVQHPQPLPVKGPTPPLPNNAVSDDEIKKMLALAAERQDSQQVVLDFDKASNQPVVKIIDRTSGEVIIQFPPEVVVRLAEMINNSPLLDEKI